MIYIPRKRRLKIIERGVYDDRGVVVLEIPYTKMTVNLFVAAQGVLRGSEVVDGQRGR